MRKPIHKNKEISTCITVTSKECRGDNEKMVRKFLKKVKRDGILDEFKERAHFKKPTTLRAEKKRATKRLIEKVNKKASELINPRSSRTTARRRRNK